MEYREQSSIWEQVKDINCVVDGDTCSLSWMWPNGVGSVYICRTREHEEISIDEITKNNSKLYTRDEYMEFNGYHEKVSDIGRFTYTIYPMVRDGGEMLLIKQNDTDNRVVVCTGKIHIGYAIKERKKLFSGKKIVAIRVSPEAPLSREVLCYVKKTGAVPMGIDDGMVFPFIQDFKAGDNIMPEIEINKDEYIKLFLMDSSKYGEIYELILI